MYTHDEIKQMLKDYCWMTNALMIELEEVESNSISICIPKTSMTKGTNNYRVCDIVLKNEYAESYLKKLAMKLKFIDDHEHVINDEKNICIVRLLKKGCTYRDIASVIQLHQSQVSKRIDRIVKELSTASMAVSA